MLPVLLCVQAFNTTPFLSILQADLLHGCTYIYTDVMSNVHRLMNQYYKMGTDLPTFRSKIGLFPTSPLFINMDKVIFLELANFESD